MAGGNDIPWDIACPLGQRLCRTRAGAVLDAALPSMPTRTRRHTASRPVAGGGSMARTATPPPSAAPAAAVGRASRRTTRPRAVPRGSRRRATRPRRRASRRRA